MPEPCQKELKSFKMPMLLRNDLDTLRHIKSFQAPLQIVEGDMEKALAGSQIGSYSIFQKGFRTLGSVQSDGWWCFKMLQSVADIWTSRTPCVGKMERMWVREIAVGHCVLACTSCSWNKEVWHAWCIWCKQRSSMMSYVDRQEGLPCL